MAICAVVLATAAVSAAPASAVEAGVNISASANQTPTLKTLGTHWVRFFLSWRVMEPTRGAISPSLSPPGNRSSPGCPPAQK
ncbi:MAG TPA: hypothetical protein VK655_02445 [Solirubrobacteraceae bacterium]|nr:hypothetical protein [Solirubrobacteraceae bacterium]